VIVPPEGRGVVGVNTSVKGTDDFPATRSDDAMTKDTFITWVITLEQVLGEVAPTTIESVPAGQNIHAVAPELGL
jgi:hypothetical protein